MRFVDLSARAEVLMFVLRIRCRTRAVHSLHTCRTGLNSDAQLGLGSANSSWGARPRETGNGLPFCDLGQGDEVRGASAQRCRCDVG